MADALHAAQVERQLEARRRSIQRSIQRDGPSIDLGRYAGTYGGYRLDPEPTYWPEPPKGLGDTFSDAMAWMRRAAASAVRSIKP